jgi:hypothetical protein
MEKFKKYILIAFLVENILTQTILVGRLTDYVFYPFMVIGLSFLFSPSMWTRKNLQKFGGLFALAGIYVIYQFTFGLDNLNGKNCLYLLAKLSTFGIMMAGIGANEDFYKQKALPILFYTMAAFLLWGVVSGGEMNVNGRARAGFTNENTAGAMGAFTVGMVLFYTKNNRWTISYFVVMLIGFYGVLAGASRAGFLMLFLLIFLRYGVNIKTVGIVGLLFVFGTYVLPAIGVETVGIQRLTDTIDGKEGTNRDIERLAGEWMISQKPISGWGFNVTNQGYAASLTPMPSHNGYIEIAKQIGIPMAVLYFSVIVVTTLTYLRRTKQHKKSITIYGTIVIMSFLKANYEGMFIGVHDCTTNLFFFSYAMMIANSFQMKR